MERNQISLKSAVSNVPTVLSLNNCDAITNPYDIFNTFNNFSASIAETTKKKAENINLNFFPSNLEMKIVTQCSCNTLIKKK